MVSFWLHRLTLTPLPGTLLPISHPHAHPRGHGHRPHPGEIARQAAHTVRPTAAGTLPHACHRRVFHQRSRRTLLRLKTDRLSHTQPAPFPLAYDPVLYRNRPATGSTSLPPSGITSSEATRSSRSGCLPGEQGPGPLSEIRRGGVLHRHRAADCSDHPTDRWQLASITDKCELAQWCCSQVSVISVLAKALGRLNDQEALFVHAIRNTYAGSARLLFGEGLPRSSHQWRPSTNGRRHPCTQLAPTRPSCRPQRPCHI